MKKNIVFVVGHESWGKSRTLSALTDGNYRQRRIVIKGVEFYIRRMSNDDRPKSYVDFMTSISLTKTPQLIATLCPNFTRSNAKTEHVLRSLKEKGYSLYFWVIEHQHGTSQVVTEDEIKRLRAFGYVEIFSQQAEASVRSMRFKKFVINTVL